MLLNLIAKLKLFLCCKMGATAMEYALIAAGVSISIYIIAFVMGDTLADLYDIVQAKLAAAVIASS